MSTRPDTVPAIAEEQEDGTWILLDILDDESAIRREAWAPDGKPLFLEHLDVDTKERRQICLYFDEGTANLDFMAGVGVVTRTDATCRSLGPTLPEFPNNPDIVRLTFQIVDPEPAFLRYQIGVVAFEDRSEEWVDATGEPALPPTWGADAHAEVDLGATQETDVQPPELMVEESANAFVDAEPSMAFLDDTQETDAEFDGSIPDSEAFDDGDDTDSMTDQIPVLEIEVLPVNEPMMPDSSASLEKLAGSVPDEVPPSLDELAGSEPDEVPPSLDELAGSEPSELPPSLDELAGDGDDVPDLDVEIEPLDMEPVDDLMLSPDDEADDEFMLPPDDDSEVVEDEVAFEVPLAQVVGSDRDGRFISTHADDSVSVEAIYEDGTLMSLSKTNIEKKPEFRRTLADGRDMLVIYGPEGTLSYIRTQTSRRVQVQQDGLVKWDQSADFDAKMDADGFKEAFSVYDKLHRHFAYHKVKTPWRLEAFGFEPYSAMVDEFDQFFDATIFAENRAGDWLVMIDEPGPHQGKIFLNFHQDGLYHLDVLDEFVMDYVEPELVDDRNALIEDMPFFSDEPILGGYARFYAELNLYPVDDLLSDLRHVPVLDLADLM